MRGHCVPQRVFQELCDRLLGPEHMDGQVLTIVPQRSRLSDSGSECRLRQMCMARVDSSRSRCHRVYVLPSGSSPEPEPPEESSTSAEDPRHVENYERVRHLQAESQSCAVVAIGDPRVSGEHTLLRGAPFVL